MNQKILLIIIIIIICISLSFLFTACGGKTEQAFLREGNSIEFGSYPQTEVKDHKLITALNEKAGTLPTSFNSSFWTSYGYYIDGNVVDYMWYIDVEEGGNKYRGVYFTQYRPYITSYSSSIDNSHQDDNGYYTNTVYWFKYEPIKWTIVETTNGYATLVCDIAIDSQEFSNQVNCDDDEEWQFNHNGGEGYSNNYALSNIRKWLNETFYNIAFNGFQKKSIIQTTEVDNSLESTKESKNMYICENTEDKVYLLSLKEATTYYKRDSARQKKSSDYAKSQGCDVSDDYLDNCSWWLRSPFTDFDFFALCAVENGEVGNVLSCVWFTHHGVVPSLRIKL